MPSLEKTAPGSREPPVEDAPGETRGIAHIKEVILQEARAIVDAGMYLKFRDLTRLVVQRHAVQDKTFRATLRAMVAGQDFKRATALVERLVQDLADEHVLQDNSKLTRFNLLENANRRRIHDRIVARPGVTFAGLADIASAETVTHHLDKLLQFRLIRFRVFGKTRCYFPAWFPTARDFRAHLLQKPHLREIAEVLQARGSLPLRALADAVGKSRSTVQYRLKRLIRGGAVEKRGSRRKRRYAWVPPD